MNEQEQTVSTPVSKNIEATVKHIDGYGKVRKATEATIRFNGKIVATKVLGGEYNAIQASREFARSQSGWTIKDSVTLEHCKQLGIIK